MPPAASECRSAVEALDRALEDEPGRKLYDDLTVAQKCLVRLRDGLIEARRGDSGSPALARRLESVNAALSVLEGGYYPVVGVHRERIRQARDQLNAILADWAEQEP